MATLVKVLAELGNPSSLDPELVMAFQRTGVRAMPDSGLPERFGLAARVARIRAVRSCVALHFD